MATDLILQMMRDPWTWGRGVAMRWFALFLFIAFIALLVLGVALIWRRVERGSEHGTGPAGGDKAMDALRLRYANGEITREEFLQTTKDLGGPEPPPDG
jgi:uncharacterized membrane protein